MVDVTVSASAAANISSAYTGTRADQSQAPNGGFRSALEDTSSGRDRGKAASDDDRKQADVTRDKDRAQNDNGAKVDTNAAPDQNNPDDSAVAKPTAPGIDREAKAGGTTASGRDAATALAKLVAALTKRDDASTASQDAPASDAADVAPGKTPVKESGKTGDQVLVQAGTEQVIDAGTLGTDGTKPAVKSSSNTKADAKDADEGSEPVATQKDAPAGAQDVLSLLTQAAPAQAAAMPQQVTPAGDGATKSGVGTKLKDGLDAKASHVTIGKVADDAKQPTTATGQAARSSAADALHMVTAADDGASLGDDAGTVADSATLKHSDKMQSVEVVDSRRIIAPVSTSNGANIAATMTGDREWSSVMRSYSSSDVSTADRLTTDKTLNTLTIKMTPESLGTVTANLKLVDGQLTVSLVVENGTAYRKLHEDHGDLMKSLKSQGFSVDQIQISIASPDKSSSDTTQNNNQNQPNNQSLAQQNSNGQNQGGNRQQAQVSFENVGQTSGGAVDDATSHGASGTGSGGSGAGGQLYL
jgi:chemotaxis protein MotD